MADEFLVPSCCLGVCWTVLYKALLLSAICSALSFFHHHAYTSSFRPDLHTQYKIKTIMPSVRYYNQSAPFWDFVASMEDQPQNLFGGNGGPNPWVHPWAQRGWGNWQHGGEGSGSNANRGQAEGEHTEEPTAAANETTEKEGEAGPSEPRGPHHHGGPGPHRGRCGARGRGGWGGRGRGGPRHAGGFPPMMGLFGSDPSAFADMFKEQFALGGENNKDKTEDFKPEADVFDTAEAFVVHISLPGAKKEDVGVSWDQERSELSIAGVIYRPGDEELLKTLALDERKVGAFERKIRLGSRANPAQVDVEGINARMEDGVLRVEVPKLDSGYVEIKKVDIE